MHRLSARAQDVDLAYAAGARLEGLPDSEARKVFAAKETLLLRPMGRLLGDPHALAGLEPSSTAVRTAACAERLPLFAAALSISMRSPRFETVFFIRFPYLD